MNNENVMTETDTEQGLTTKESPSGRKDLVSAKAPCTSQKLGLISDENLYQLCQTYGERTRFWRQKFAGLLPEVFKRRLFEKKGFSSIYEFAAKLSGMSREQVDLVLRLERKFEDKPILRKALVEGEISANKLIRIASIATVENQEEIFEKAKILSNRAVEVFVRDVKRWNENGDGHSDGSSNGNDNQIQNSNSSPKPLFAQKTLHVHFLKLDSDVEKELAEMQEKGIDINTFLREVLQKRKEKIEQEKARIAIEQEQKHQGKPIGRESRPTCHSRPDRESMAKNNKIPVFPPGGRTGAGMTPQKVTRYIPVQIKKILHQEYGTKCSIPGCQNQAKIIHHAQRFALAQSHDPRYLAPLCKEHHELAHSADLAYCEIKNRCG